MTREYTEQRWLAEIRRAAGATGPHVFGEFVARTPVFEAALAIAHTRDDLDDVIEALRAVGRYDLSDRLRTLQRRLDQSAARLTAGALEPRDALKAARQERAG